jgi:hypothetical protein
MRTGQWRIWAGLGFLLLVANSYAADTLPSRPVPVAPAAPAPSTFPQSAPVAEPINGADVYTTDAHTLHPVVTNGEADPEPGRLFFTGEYLLMRPHRNALDFAIVAPFANVGPNGSIESVGWETRSGFRFGAGYRLPCDGWQFGFNYTYLHSSGGQDLNAPPGGTLFATLTHGGGFDDVTRASGTTSLDYNVIDLDLSKRAALNDTLDVTFFTGGRFAWIDQKLGAVYNGGSAGANNALVSSPVYFNGAGVSVGGEGFWKICHARGGAIGLFAKGRGSLLVGHFRDFLTETNNNGTVVLVNVKEKYEQIVPVAEVGIGLGWEAEHIRFRVGYELSNWFNMIHSPDFPDGTSSGKLSRRTGDLMLEGLAVKLGIEF